MSLSDCPRCWDTPCTCGEYWKNYNSKQMVDYLKGIFFDRSDVEEILTKLDLDYKDLKYKAIKKGS
jgi:hypothetical protein